MSPYYCKSCRSPVVVSTVGEVTRTCEHTGVIIAERTSMLYGDGGVDSPSAGERALAALQRVVTALRGG